MEGTLEELRRISNCPEGATFSQLGLRKSVAPYGAADRLITELNLIEAQYRASLASIRRLRDAAEVADRAYAAGNLDERSFVDLHASLLAKEIESLKLEQTLLEQRIVLQTLIGSDIPTREPDRPAVQ